jgi:D-3-phosphoglycerate dehydrogenase / 2-oxoglutarate reductase
MTIWKILLTDGLDEAGKDILRQGGEVVDRNGISADDLLKEVGEYDALIVRGRTKVTLPVFEAGRKLKVVGRAGIGVDNIDLKAAQTYGVTVVNSPLATTVSVAELTMSVMLSMIREVPRADASMKAGKWLKKEFEGVELFEKTLGIIGFGRIGTAVAKRAMAFGMNILAYDPRLESLEARETGAELVSLDELLTRSDFISLHLPLTPDSKNMLDATAFAKMKDGVRLVDAARGGIVDESALLAALETGKVAAAALDVFTAEPPGLIPLVAHPRVIATPHIGAQTLEAQGRAGLDIASEVVAALNGQPLRWKVA